jgi:hypothetical protein
MGTLALSLVMAGVAGSALTQTQVPDSARRAAAAQPLFASHEPLAVVIEAPLSRIFEERSQDPQEFPGRMVADDRGTTHTLDDLGIQTRGLARLQSDVCEFPPLRLDFDREEVVGTLFASQNRLKLVVHCQSDRAEYEQYVLQEYLAYRAFNLLTDLSFQVRLARVTYVNTDEPGDTVTRWAFLVEDQELLAARNGLPFAEVATFPPALVDPVYLALVEVFQFMVGNPDWSAFAKGPAEEECCHNTQPIGDVAGGPVFPVPYDFDVTGLVNPRYADRVFRPAQRDIGITRVRQRLFRGVCESERLWPETFRLFNERKDAIYGLFRGQAGLDPAVLRDMLAYLDEFYETINDARATREEITERCRS